MVGINDLFDISAAFTIIRSDMHYEKNIDIIKSILCTLKNKDFYEQNIIRKAISKIKDLDKEIWKFVYHENLYMYDAILKDDNVLGILIKVCETLIYQLNEHKFEIADDLIDTVHCLPAIIAENNFKIPKNYWKSHMRFYRLKWDKTFRVKEQNNLYKRII